MRNKATLATYNLGQNKMEQQTPIPPPKSRMKARKGQKRTIFPILDLGAEGGSRFSIYLVQDCNFGQNKMEQQTPTPTPKSRMKAREGQKRTIFPSLIWGGGGSRFFIYFVQDCSSRFSVWPRVSRDPAKSFTTRTLHPLPSHTTLRLQ